MRRSFLSYLRSIMSLSGGAFIAPVGGRYGRPGKRVTRAEPSRGRPPSKSQRRFRFHFGTARSVERLLQSRWTLICIDHGSPCDKELIGKAGSTMSCDTRNLPGSTLSEDRWKWKDVLHVIRMFAHVEAIVSVRRLIDTDLVLAEMGRASYRRRVCPPPTKGAFEPLRTRLPFSFGEFTIPTRSSG
jgi:hypothetical protein